MAGYKKNMTHIILAIRKNGISVSVTLSTMEGMHLAESISIGTAAQVEDLRRHLRQELGQLHAKGLDVEINQVKRGNITFLGCNLAGRRIRRGNSKLFRDYIARAISGVILNELQQTLLQKIIQHNYYYFDPEERARILSYVDGSLRLPCGRGLLSNSLKYRGEIIQKLQEFLDRHDEVVLEGFVQFRLKEYMEELEEAVDRAVDDFLQEREQKEFIELLQHFVRAQEPALPEAHVLLGADGQFQVLNENGETVGDKYLEEIVLETMQNETCYDDLLISALITIAPRRLTVHCQPTQEREENMQTIKAVFGDSMRVCHNCSLCKQR